MLPSFSAALVIFLVTIGISLLAFVRRDLAYQLAFSPYRFFHSRRYDTILTSGFIHGDLQHLLFNMLSYFFFAFRLQELFVARIGDSMGQAAFLLLYLLSIILADMYNLFHDRNNPNYMSLGASGGIAAVIFSVALLDPGMSIYFMFLPIPIPAPLYGVLYIAYSFYAQRRGLGGNINHAAHIGGAFAGIVLTLIMFRSSGQEFLAMIREMTGIYF